MKRISVIACLVVTGMFANPQPAAAGFWAWLEQFSGPGPFTTGKPPVLLTYCFQKVPKAGTADGASTPRTAFVPSAVATATDRGPFRCIYFDHASFTAPAEPASEGGRGFPEIQAAMSDYGGTVRLVDGLDVGAGMGRISFTVGEQSFSRFTVTPIRVVTRPFLLAIPDTRLKGYARQAFGAFNIYFKETFVEGELTGKQFGVENSTYKTSGELVRSWGILFDLTALLPPQWKIPWWK
jgi:hypothetical protein